ncbi:MAG: DUF423 domain-containing protein [Alphaproteobacteria bacterium]|nr:DUF423 domain-containing protein [Alphaproteobacteria bacterium]
MSGLLLILAGFAGLTAVAAGAFGAHALRASLSSDLLATYQTGALYHLVHAVALFGAALLARTASVATIAGAAGIAFAVGILVFSGSLYLLAITGTRWLGAITPVGGVSFMVGWALLIWAGFRYGA